MCVTALPARAAERAEHLSRGGPLRERGARERTCPAVRSEAGARSPEPAAPPLGWTGAASPLDRCPGRNVPTHLHTEQNWRGHPGAYLPGRTCLPNVTFLGSSDYKMCHFTLLLYLRYVHENT